MKTYKNNLDLNLVTVREEEKCAEFTHTFVIPFKQSTTPVRAITFEQVFEAYKDVIIEALQSRMNSCVSMLYRNIDRVIYSDKYCVQFARKDGTIHSFNHPSYKAMEETIVFLNVGNYRLIGKGHCDQIAKALYWIEKPSAPINGISFGNLISCIMEIAVVSNDR
jgi:hypothetical protein